MFDQPGSSFTWELSLTRTDLEQKDPSSNPQRSRLDLVVGQADLARTITMWTLEWQAKPKDPRKMELFVFTKSLKRSDLVLASQTKTLPAPCTVKIVLRLVTGHQTRYVNWWSFKIPLNDTAGTHTLLDGSGIVDLVTTHGRAKFRITVHNAARIEQSARESVKASERERSMQEIQNELNRMSERIHPFDVCFEFSNSRRTLWEDSAHVKSKSPYWKTLLEGGFSNSTKKRWNSGRSLCDHPFFVINVEEEEEQDLFEPYRHILAWARSGSIFFSALQDRTLSNFDPIEPEPSSMLVPSSHLTVDPITIFEISKFLQLDSLAAVALADIPK
ncbi:BQ2448_4374 [Microbotryum intermedium]|uniref:BQ2448_4374 protein n=1 Tax=Microbotryum intermedium TaxID=269621 RepID=A0A238FHX5_9BASI|nr:BQ2448_4374 [Microbotryum intermedium]